MADARSSSDPDRWSFRAVDLSDTEVPSTSATAPLADEPDLHGHADAFDPLPGDQLVETARALGDPTRLRILELIGDGERYAQEIVTALDIAQSAVSRHLSLLERSGLVHVRPQRGMKYYSIDERFAKRLIATLEHRLVGPR
jgi:DNA-binding transcriptional ArsR family regulator